MSSTDDRDELKRKILEYQECVVKLGWLIDPEAKEVYIYRASVQEVEIPNNPNTLSGEDVLLGLIVESNDIITD